MRFDQANQENKTKELNLKRRTRIKINYSKNKTADRYRLGKEYMNSEYRKFHL